MYSFLFGNILTSLFFVSFVLNIADGVLLSRADVYLTSEQIANVIHVVVDHGRAFKTKTPGND